MKMDGCLAASVCGADADCAATPAAFDAVVKAPMLGLTTVGRPTAAPFTWMLKAFRIYNALKVVLPATRMPAAPASIRC